MTIHIWIYKDYLKPDFIFTKCRGGKKFFFLKSSLDQIKLEWKSRLAHRFDKVGRYNRQKPTAEQLQQRLENRRAYSRACAALRWKMDPRLRRTHTLRARLHKAVKCAKPGETWAKTTWMIGCSLLELRRHLESQFRLGMNWHNYGPVWVLDHIVPLSKFNLFRNAEVLRAFHYSNLQPLFDFENRRKGTSQPAIIVSTSSMSPTTPSVMPIPAASSPP